jgi:hypothetical protein
MRVLCGMACHAADRVLPATSSVSCQHTSARLCEHGEGQVTQGSAVATGRFLSRLMAVQVTVVTNMKQSDKNAAMSNREVMKHVIATLQEANPSSDSRKTPKLCCSCQDTEQNFIC